MSCKHKFKLGAALKQNVVRDYMSGGNGAYRVLQADTASFVKCWKCTHCGKSIAK